MPSLILTFLSGGENILSGLMFSGHPMTPLTGMNLRLSPSASGLIFYGYSGGITVNSGSFRLSGGAYSGAMDGMPLSPGGTVFLSKLVLGTSGQPQLFVTPEAACSGQARLYWEIL